MILELDQELAETCDNVDESPKDSGESGTSEEDDDEDDDGQGGEETDLFLARGRLVLLRLLQVAFALLHIALGALHLRHDRVNLFA